MRNAIHQWVILPLAYLWWRVGLFYRLLPQVVLWAILIFIVLYSAVRSLLTQFPSAKETKHPRLISRGPIEDLSALVVKRKRGNYYKWLIANRLGKAARELLDQREGRRLEMGYVRLQSRTWDPPQAVAAYLEAGLNGSFADYPRPRWKRPRPTPLDEPPLHAVEYLESELEAPRYGD
jgi:hypothetical protein